MTMELLKIKIIITTIKTIILIILNAGNQLETVVQNKKILILGRKLISVKRLKVKHEITFCHQRYPKHCAINRT